MLYIPYRMTGKELRAIRDRLQWTQVQLAEAVGVTSNTIARWERDEIGIKEPIARYIKTVIAGTKKTGGEIHARR